MLASPQRRIWGREHMPVEIERRFLVSKDGWQGSVNRTKSVCQAYLSQNGCFTARVRIVDGETATLTIKSSRAGLSRLEFEYAIPIEDAEQLMLLGQGRIIEKRRHLVTVDGLVWEIDVFEGANAGLVLAEIELSSESQELKLPPWIGVEVTEDSRYYNSNLSLHPFESWSDDAADRVGV